MQNKGIVITTAVLLTLVCLFYLSFPVATKYYDNKAAELKDPIAQQDYKDSVKYLGIYSYQKCLETQIGLGLDLKGGMNVILEISVPDVVENLADHKTDMAFTKSMNEARKEQMTSQEDFVTLLLMLTIKTLQATSLQRCLPHSSFKEKYLLQALIRRSKR